MLPKYEFQKTDMDRTDCDCENLEGLDRFTYKNEGKPVEFVASVMIGLKDDKK